MQEGAIIIDTQYKKYWVWATLLKKLGTNKKIEILQKFNNDIEQLFYADRQTLIKKHINEKTANIILEDSIKQQIDKHLKYMKKNNIDIISILDEKYPIMLKQIYDPPICIYIRGNKDVLNMQKSIAIIGCRESSAYGENIAKKLAYNISKNSINIVSGLARGIDSKAHEGAILAGEKTIAVLGNGLDEIYPKENTKLAIEILKKDGAIISEYPLGTKPEKRNFPQRNRIVSGLSKGIIVIEAKKQSGTLITVDFALEQGRDVYVVPGNIDSKNSEGTNELIKQGAKLITDYKDVIEEYERK